MTEAYRTIVVLGSGGVWGLMGVPTVGLAILMIMIFWVMQDRYATKKWPWLVGLYFVALAFIGFYIRATGDAVQVYMAPQSAVAASAITEALSGDRVALGYAKVVDPPRAQSLVRTLLSRGLLNASVGAKIGPSLGRG